MDMNTTPVESTPPQEINVNQAPITTTQVPPIPSAQPIPLESVQPVENKGSKRLIAGILIGLGIFIGLFVLLFLVVNSTTKEPFKASNDFLAGFANSDAQTIYNSSSTEFQEAVTLSEFEIFFDKYKVIPFSEAKVTGKKIETTNSTAIATFTYTITYDSNLYEVEIKMIKDGEVWKLLTMQIQ